MLIHYGAPLVTANNTVIVTVKTGASGGFRVDGFDANTGTRIYTEPTDYTLPSANWTPSCGSTITPDNRLVTPAIGGTVLIRANADDPSSVVTRVAFYGIANYTANPSAFNSAVKIDTPITTDSAGNVYFGFTASANPSSLVSGLARISSTGVGSWIASSTLAGDANATKIPVNCAPAISNDGASVYVATTGGGNYLIQANTTTLAMVHKVVLHDPKSGNVANVPNDGTASPMVGPDGDVYFGVLESPGGSNRLRGWMLHFDGTLAIQKPSGAFGWDDTAAVVPRSMVPTYTGSSAYLLLTKYNDYLEGGGPGDNRIAILDPNAIMIDPISGIPVMSEVLTKLGPTADPRGGVIEWCINTAAIDPLTNSALVNSEDGKSYRWNLATNALSQTMTLTSGVGEAYTPTAVGPDGTVYCINNAIVFALSNNTVRPTSFSMLHGTLSGGTLTDLLYSEDSRMGLNPDYTLSRSMPPVQVQVDATSFSATASSMTLTVECRASNLGVLQTIEMFNFSSGLYETVDSRGSTTTDSVIQLSVTGNPTRFIDPTTRAMRARVSFRTGLIVNGPRWTASIDQVAWTVNP